jgi:hypothetical protein
MKLEQVTVYRWGRVSSAQPETATPSPTMIAKPSTVSGALAPRSSATPAPITGTASPT